MRAALYARYSSEHQREASIEDQYRNCERYAAREGWSIVERFADKGISGTKGEKGRDGYGAMLKAAQARRFDVLLVDDFARLSRDQVETETARRRLVHWGIRLIGVSDGIDTAAKGHKMLSSFKGIMNECYLDDLRDKTHRGLEGQALKGHNCGGRSYGYRHVPITDATQNDEYGRPKIVAVRREIDEAQARWIRFLFQEYARGRSPRAIADELNRRRIPGPAAAYRRRRPSRSYGTWCATAFHGDLQQATGMLSNPLYIGRVIWNRREWAVDPGDEARRLGCARNRNGLSASSRSCGFIPQKLWEQVQQRRAAQAKGQLLASGRARDGRGPKYLLSGLLEIESASSFVIADTYRYGCGGHINRGASVARMRCASRARLRRGTLSRCAASRSCFRRTRWSEFSTRRRACCCAPPRVSPERGDGSGAGNSREGKIANIVTAIKAGILTATTKRKLQQAEAGRTRLQEALGEAGEGSKAETVATLFARRRALPRAG